MNQTSQKNQMNQSPDPRHALGNGSKGGFHFVIFRMSQFSPRGSEEDETVHEVGVICVCMF